MADDQPANLPGNEPAGFPPADVVVRSWSNLWQVPAMLIGAGLITAGIVVAVQNRPKGDFDGALTQVEYLIEQDRLEAALTQLRDVIEPSLDLASPAQRAKFHALVADWVFVAQAAQGRVTPADNQRIDQQYARALGEGLILDPARIERWALTLISMGDLGRARERLAQLDGLDAASTGDSSVRDRRNRVFRRLIERSLTVPDSQTGADEMIALLRSYLEDDRLSTADRAWAVAQQAAIRLEAGRPREAVDHLLVDMRRLEHRAAGAADTPAAAVDFGAIYTMLGRGYFDLGENALARVHLLQALDGLDAHAPARGDALGLLGRLDFADTDYDGAFGHFDQVVRDFVGTASYLPGLLGRAEVRSVLGDHDGSREDYRQLRDALVLEALRRDVNAHRIAESLRDRHDAALASRRLDLALDYALIAESLFERLETPANILVRIASTSRALGERLLAERGDPADADEADPARALERRRQAAAHFRQAGDYSIRHARVLATRPESDSAWAEALWLGSDAYDLGGWYDLAVTHMTEYINSRSTDDPRRAEALYRLASAYHAQLEFGKASEFYEQVLANHPRSQFASASHVPLARCLRLQGRSAEAEQQLRQVVAGQRFLDPAAVDFRDALVELGGLYHDDGQFAEAIEILQEAVTRYPDDPTRNEILFRLADSYRGHAVQIARRLDDERLPPSERDRLAQVRDGHLRQAIERYAAVCESQERVDADRRSEPQRDLLRQGYLYQADCLFHLGDFLAAIEMYDFAARKFSMHHSSMYALVQIVNCYSELGQAEDARTAHRRALVRLDQLPPNTFDAPDSLMNREAWERWLRNSPVAPRHTASALPAQP